MVSEKTFAPKKVASQVLVEELEVELPTLSHSGGSWCSVPFPGGCSQHSLSRRFT